jgi:hypothetical protein
MHFPLDTRHGLADTLVMAKHERPTRILGGYDLDDQLMIVRKRVDTSRPGDYGADPVGDGTFRMVPSGDIVDLAERNRRLG